MITIVSKTLLKLNIFKKEDPTRQGVGSSFIPKNIRTSCPTAPFMRLASAFLCRSLNGIQIL
ncbi:hypothetical protein D3C77_820380 [compost metagenome]